MLTIFTTTKDFTGQNLVNQLNAIRSWLSAPYPVEVLIFQKRLEYDYFKEYKNIRFIENYKENSNGVPYINSMFELASKYSQYDACCYVNADIIIGEFFFKEILKIHQKLYKKYLLVGQRLDFNIDYLIDFTKGWEETFFEKHHENMKLHTPTGSDFFVFPKGQYSRLNMPDLLVGRPGWDLWMIYNGRKAKYKVVDLSYTCKVWHQNHDYSHKSLLQVKNEDPHNYSFLPQDQKYTHTLLSCNYLLVEDKLKNNYSRFNIDSYLKSESIFGNKYKAWIKEKLVWSIVKYL